MTQIRLSVLGGAKVDQDYLGETLVKLIKHPPLPDGTGQIINIRI